MFRDEATYLPCLTQFDFFTVNIQPAMRIEP